MLRRRTVFIIGAGASKEFGLPLGSELAREIARILDFKTDAFNRLTGGNDDVRHCLAAESRERNENTSSYGGACKRIRDAIPHHNSIDNLIDNHADEPQVAFCGKLAIAHRILSGERSSSLFVDPSNLYNDIAFDRVSDTWLPTLFKMMQEGVPRSKVEHFFQNTAFITFNYDRCIEHYFHRALQSAYALPEGTAAQIVSSASIQHVYGSVGVLPWQPHGARSQIEFGKTNIDLRSAAKSLRTYSERTDQESALAAIQRPLQQAEVIVMLGFGYLGTNVEVISPSERNDPALVLGSTLGLSEFNTTQVRDRLAKWFARGQRTKEIILPHGSTAKSLLDDYGRALI